MGNKYLCQTESWIMSGIVINHKLKTNDLRHAAHITVYHNDWLISK